MVGIIRSFFFSSCLVTLTIIAIIFEIILSSNLKNGKVTMKIEKKKRIELDR